VLYLHCKNVFAGLRLTKHRGKSEWQEEAYLSKPTHKTPKKKNIEIDGSSRYL
jgi:hypothetical protein